MVLCLSATQMQVEPCPTATADSAREPRIEHETLKYKSEKLKVKRAESQKMLSLKKQAQADNERFKATRGSGVFGDE